MYVLRGGRSVSTYVPTASDRGVNCWLTQEGARRLLQLRGLGVTPAPAHLSPHERKAIETQQSRSIGPRIHPPTPSTTTTSTSSSGTPAQTLPAVTPPTAPAIPGSPVPQNWPTTQLFSASDGTVWQFVAASGQWKQISSQSIVTGVQTWSGTPVPKTQPTNTPYTDGSGQIWVYSGNVGTWIPASAANTLNPTGSGFYPGTPVPNGYPTSAPFTDSAGNVWTYAPATGGWVNASLSSASLYSTASGASSYPGTIAAPSSAQSLLDWLSQQTLIAGVPNWMLAAGAGLVALKFSSGGRR